ncbi:MAG: ChbG/HpnK family deacetylase [Parcubacteria group bacterium]
METKKIRDKFILNADDFGRSPEANTNILSLAKSGKLDRVSVLITRTFSSEEAAELLQTGAKIDLHLDLPSGARIRGHGQKTSTLQGSFLFLLKYFLRQITPIKIEREWTGQLQKFQKIFGKSPDGINSHQHIHFFPAYFKIILRLAQEYKINFVRFGKSGLLDSDNSTYKILCRLHKKNERLFAASNLNSSDFMASLDWIRNFEKFTNNLPKGEIELVCHPERKEELELIQKYFQ